MYLGGRLGLVLVQGAQRRGEVVVRQRVVVRCRYA